MPVESPRLERIECCSSFARRWLILAVLVVPACGGRDAQNGAIDADSIPKPDTASVAVPDAPVGDSGAPKLLPIDEADSSFTEFRRELLVRLQQRDTAYLYSILAPEIKNSFGGDDRIEGFRSIWKMDRPDSSAIWSTLSRALTLGGKLDRDQSNNLTTFRAPYVYATWPNDIDAFQHVAVTDVNAPVYERPDATAPVVAIVSHSILPFEEWQGIDHDGIPGPGAFARVKLPSGKSVWISASQVYSPVGWRAFFEKRGNRWVMTIFVAGD